MSGPCYVGVIVERWSSDALEGVMRALAHALLPEIDSAEDEGRFDLRVYAHEGSAWLSVDDASGIDTDNVGSGAALPLAFAIAKAAASPAWLYEYNDTSALYMAATRISASGEAELPVEAHDDTEVPGYLQDDDPELDTARYGQDLLAAAICKHVRWRRELLRTGADDSAGPALLSRVSQDSHSLEAYFGAAREDVEQVARPAPPPSELRVALDRLHDDAARATRALDNLIAVLSQDEPEIERYLARARDDRLAAAFDPLLETLRTIAESFVSARLEDIPLPLSEKATRRLELQRTARGAPKTRAELLHRVESARVGITRQTLSNLGDAILAAPKGAKERMLVSAQVKLIRLMLHLAHIALLEGEDILRADADAD